MTNQTAKRVLLIGFTFVQLLTLLSCSAKNKVKPVLYRNAYEVPRTIAVLPFRNDTDEDGLDEKVRESIAGHLAVLNYRDMELSEVDLRLDEYSQRTGRSFEQLSMEELGFVLGCDAVVAGEVTVARRLFLGIYAQLAVGACMEIWDTRSGEMIWADRHVVRYHKGGLPTEPIGLVMTGYGTYTSLSDYIKWRAIDELGRYLVDTLPEPRYFEEDTFAAYAYEVQMAAFLSEGKANSLLNELRSAGYDASIHTNHDERGLWYRVIVGPFDNQLQADQLSRELAKRFKVEPVVRAVPNNAQ